MGKCIVKGCESRSQIHTKASGITFHSIPKDDRREKWIEVIRLLRKETDWMPSKSTVICSKHFRNQDLIGAETERGRVHLLNDAIPVLPDSDTKKYFEVPIVEETLDDVESDEEMHEILATPEEKHMMKVIKRMKELSKKRFKKINILAEQNRKLQKNNKQLKIAIQELKIAYKRKQRNPIKIEQDV